MTRSATTKTTALRSLLQSLICMATLSQEAVCVHTGADPREAAEASCPLTTVYRDDLSLVLCLHPIQLTMANEISRALEPTRA